MQCHLGILALVASPSTPARMGIRPAEAEPEAEPAPTVAQHAISLPCFTFTSDGRLESVNLSARKVLGPKLGSAGDEFEAIFPTRAGAGAEPVEPRQSSSSCSRLSSLASACAVKADAWDETVVVEFRVADGDRLGRAEAKVTDADKQFTIVLVRSLPSLANDVGHFVPQPGRSFLGMLEDCITMETDPHMLTYQALSAHELSQLVNEVPQIVFVSSLAGTSVSPLVWQSLRFGG